MNRVFLMLIICILLPTALCPMSASAEQKCKDSIITTNPDSSFLLHGDGTATQKTTGLMWMRCNLGQQWDGNTCNGMAAGFSWGEALNAAVLTKFSVYSDWRLPNKNELESIVEEHCVLPSINTSVFPTTPLTFHWTSTPYTGLGTGAWSVDFGFGVVTATEKSGKVYVRLVRDVD
jgi:hypothetical protein